LHGNEITDNLRGPDGGIRRLVVVSGDPGSPSIGNAITHNTITGDDPDLCGAASPT
jgi:hypothetical protein